jgi:hypothetical protein
LGAGAFCDEAQLMFTARMFGKKSQTSAKSVIPAKAGIQLLANI